MKLDPWIHKSLVCFAVFNTALGVYLFFYHPHPPLDAVSPLMKQPIWAVVFLLAGLLTFWGLVKKHQELLWTLMVAGLFIKLSWTFGFGFRTLKGGTLFSLIIWSMVAAWQYLVVRYFHNERV